MIIVKAFADACIITFIIFVFLFWPWALFSPASAKAPTEEVLEQTTAYCNPRPGIGCG